jgi:osmotically-inducible protein OsmY
MKKRLRILGLGAIAAAAAAFFLQPKKGAERREAVRRGGERLVRQGASVTSLIGTGRRHQDRGAAIELRLRIEDALAEALGHDGFALRVTAGDDGTVTVRGEVGSLDQIRRASAAIERQSGGAEVVNLIRLRTPAAGGPVPG